MGGCLNSLFVVCLSKLSNRDGRMRMFESMAARRVMETSTPRATVPPKSERANIPKPKKRMMALYIRLWPVSFRERTAEERILQFVACNS